MATARPFGIARWAARPRPDDRRSTSCRPQCSDRCCTADLLRVVTYAVPRLRARHTTRAARARPTVADFCRNSSAHPSQPGRSEELFARRSRALAVDLLAVAAAASRRPQTRRHQACTPCRGGAASSPGFRGRHRRPRGRRADRTDEAAASATPGTRASRAIRPTRSAPQLRAEPLSSEGGDAWTSAPHSAVDVRRHAAIAAMPSGAPRGASAQAAERTAVRWTRALVQARSAPPDAGTAHCRRPRRRSAWTRERRRNDERRAARSVSRARSAKATRRAVEAPSP